MTGTAAPAALRAPRASVARAFTQILWRDVFVTGRELPVFLAQVVLQPFFLLFVFGRILTDLGFARAGYASLLVPGVVSLTIVLTALQSTAFPLVIDFSFTKEIEDRLLAPLPVWLVGIEKMVFAALRALIAGAVMIPIAALVIRGLHLSADHVPLVLLFAVLAAFVGAAMGLTLGTMVPPNRINIMFALVLTPLLFTGCSQYPWPSLSRLPWFKVVTLFNPMTYASEGLRASLLPAVPHMNVGVAVAVLGLALVLFTATGVRGFLRRAID